MKKILSFMIAIIIILSFNIIAFAGGPNNGVIYAGGAIPQDPISTAEEICSIRNNSAYSEEMKTKLISKILAKQENEEKQVRSINTAEFVLSNFPYYYQEGTYWCVPACVRMTLKYINGSAPTQTIIAGDMNVDNNSGVTLTVAKEYLNENQSSASYVQTWPDTVSEMKNDFYDIMYYEDAPAIICTIFSTADGYPYNMNYYHALCVTGQTENGASFRLHDPILNASIPESYYVSASGIMVGLSNYIA